MTGRRRSESGNVFFTLFGAVALVGVIGAATATLMRGPVGTMVTLNQKAKADAQMEIAGKLSLLEAASQKLSGADNSDCDADGYVEPLPPLTAGCATKPVGGGCLPAEVGSAKQDPWGTTYGYCSWDLGPMTTSGCRTGLHTGEDGQDKLVMAIISAGADRTFQTSCSDAPTYLTKVSGSDDIILEYTYAAAITASGGLWVLKSGAPDTATIDKSIEVSGTAKFQSGITGNTSFSNGSFNFAGATGFFLPDQTNSGPCAPSNAGSLRTDKSSGVLLQICDPTAPAGPHNFAGWIDVGGANAGTGVAGADQQVQFNKNGAFGASSNFTWDDTANKLTVSKFASTSDATIGGTLGVTGNTNFQGVVYTSGAVNVGGALNVTGKVTASNDVQVNGNVNINNNAEIGGNGIVDGTLNVTGLSTLIGGARVGQGSAGSPGIAFVSASTTGLFYSSGGIGLSVGGTQRAEVTSSGLDISGNETVSGTAAITGNVSGNGFHLGSLNSGIGLYSNGSGGLTLNTGALSRIEIDSGGDIGIGLVSAPTTDLDIGGVIRLRQMGAMAGANCGAINGAITYSSGDVLLVCSNVTGNWETIGTSGGGGGGAASYWVKLVDGRIYYTANNVGIGTNDPLAKLHVNGDFLTTGGYSGTASMPVSGAGTRLVFDPDSGSFRAGSVSGTQWDDGSIGLHSIALGNNVTASGNYAMGLGLGTNGGTVSGASSLGIFMGNQTGVTLSDNNVMGLFGGRMVIDPNEPSTMLTPAGSLALGVSGNVGALNFCDENGTNCFTAADIAGGVTGAPGNNREILYNSGGVLGTNSAFVFTSSLYMGLGTSTPTAKFDVTDAIRVGSSQIGCSVSTKGAIRYNSTNNNFDYCGGSVPSWTGFSSNAAAAGSTGQVQFNSAGLLGASANLFWDNANGRLGIGTSSPTQSIETNGNLQLNATALNTGGDIIIDQSGSGFTKSIFFQGFGATQFQLASSLATNEIQLNAYQGRALTFLTGPSTTATERMRITSSGQVGIGTLTPSASLDVGGTDAIYFPRGTDAQRPATPYNGMMRYSSTGNDFEVYANNAWRKLVTSTGGLTAAAGSDTYIQYNSNGSLAGSAGLVYTSAGYVGIATTSPLARLEVAGTDSILFPRGNTGNRPSSPVNGMMRYNNVNDRFEAYQGNAWQDILTNASIAGGSDRQIQFNSGNTLAGATGFVYTASGRLGLGTASPATLLDVNGTIRIAYGGESCSVATLGGIYYSSVTGNFYACGTAGNWTQISTGASGTAAGSDQQFQYNNNGVLAGATGIVYNSATGYVGIGATPPAAKLDVSGEIRVGSANTLTCVAGTKGAIRYNSSTDGFDYCGGSTPSWIAFTNASSPGTAAGLNGYVQFKSSTGNLAGDSSLFWDDANKRLAIGTSTPIVDLSIYKAISPRFIMTSAGTDTASQILMSFLTLSGSSSDTLGLASSKGWQIATRGNAWSSAALANDMGFNYWDGSTWKTVLGLDSVNAYVGIGTAQPVAKLEVTDAVRIGSSQLGCTAATTGTIRYNSTNNNFDYCGGSTPSWTSFTANAAAAGSTYQIQYNSGGLLGASSTFVFTSAGRLGVGTSSPSEILDVNGNAQLVFGGLLGTNLNYTFTYDGDTLGDYALGWYNDSWYGGAGTGALSGYGGLKFFTGQSPRLSITQAGSVGIGTTSPAAQLDVAEAVRIGSSQLGCVTATKGAIRYNSTTNAFDYCGGSTPSWTSFASNVTLGGSDTYIQYNNNGVLAGSSGLVFRSATGRVGIGTAVPATLLDVNGTLRMAYGGESCSASTLGGMYYSSVTGNFYVCGTAGSWTQISTGASGTAAGSDKQFQYNNNGVLAGATGIVYNSATGYVGIGAASPAAKLEVADALRIGSSTLGCAAGTVGAIRYNSTTNAFDYCGGSTPIWTSFAGSVTPGGSDTYIQYNSNGSLAGSAGLVYTSAGRVGIGTASPNTNLTIQNTNSSTTLANFTQALTNGGINVVSNYGAGDTYTPGIFWSTADNNPTKPKAGVWTESTNSGSILNFGVSNSYVTGITSAATLDYNGTLTLNSSNLNKFNQFITSIPGDSVLNINANNNGATAEWELSSNTYIAAKFTGSEKFRITSAGKMGIGTTSPATIFDANGTIRMAYGGESCSASTLGAMYYSSATGLFYACGTAGSWTQISTGASGTAAGSDKQFQYNNNGVLAGATGIVYNSATGYVGIGTTSPQNAVHVYAAGGSGLEISSQGVSGTSQSAITMLTSASGAGDYLPTATSKGWEIHARGDAYATSGQRNDLGFSYWNGSYWVDPLLIDSATAYVGIYTTSPAAALDVGDAIRVGSSTLGCATGTKGAIRYNSSTNGFDYCGGSTPGWTAFSGAGATAAGSDQQVQLNNGGVLYASTGLTYNSSTGLLTSINRISVGGSGRDTNSVMITGGNTTSTGTANVFIGGSAGAGNTTGAGNIAIGYQASQTADALLGNTAVGYQALKVATTGADLSTAVGYQALAAATTGGMNTALGNAALLGNTDGYQNTAVGYAAGSIVQSGIGNTFIGKGAMQYAGTASYNAVVGQNAGDSMQSGSSNVIFGQDAASGGTNLTFDGATIIGKGAGYLNDGDGNIFIGYLAGDAVTTGTNNIVIGYNVDAPSATGSNQLAIGNLLFGTGIDGTGTSLSSGKIGIGTSSPAAKLDVAEAVKVGSSTLGCAAGTVGAIRYNSTTNAFDYCGGAGPAWTSFASNVTPGGSDSYVQYNNNGVLAGSSGLAFKSATSRLGIATTSPVTALDVNGTLRMAYGGETCSASTLGAMYYSSATGLFYACGTAGSWTQISTGASGTAAGSDKQFQYNNNGALAGATGVVYNSATGYVGIGAASPAAKLDVADAIRVGSSTLGCATGTKGAIRYNSATNVFDFCNGTAWSLIGSGNALALNDLSDVITDYTTDHNMWLGSGSGAAIATGGQYNIALGENAGAAVSTGDNNIFIGESAGAAVNTGAGNVGIGRWALKTATSGSNNTAVGYLALQAATGSGNTSVGSDSLRTLTTGLSNTALGNGALYTNSTSNDNTAVGFNALQLATGANNIAIGSKAGDAITTGANNIVIGYDVDAPSATTSNQLVIGNLLFGTGIDGTGTVLSTGKIGIGTAAPAAKLDIADAVRVGSSTLGCATGTVGAIRYNSANNNFDYCGGAGPAWTSFAGSVTPGGSDTYVQYNNNGVLAGSSGLVFRSATGRVGIGTALPATLLDVNGTLRMAYGGESCSASTLGAMYYSSATGLFYACGTAGSWTQISTGASGTAAGSDKQFQYNNNGALAGATGIVYNSATGYVGIGAASPAAKLDVADALRIGSSTLGCAAGTKGAIRYNSSTDGFDYCGGSTPSWTSFAGSVMPGGSDSYVQYNNNGVLAGSSGLAFKSATSRLGIATVSPATALDVNGTLRMAYGGESCSASTLGAIYYSSATGLFYACGTAGSWTQISTGASGTASGSDKQVQLNNNGVLYASSGFTFNSTSGVMNVGFSGGTAGYVRTGPGSNAAPSFSFVNDTDTGFYNSASDTINFVTGGTTKASISPGGTLTVSSFTIQNEATWATQNMTAASDSSNWPTIIMTRSRNTLAAPAYPQASDTMGSIGFRNKDGFDIASIFAYASENHSASTAGTGLRFYTTASGSTSNSVRMTIASTGYVGIGVAAPVMLLDVNDAVKVGSSQIGCITATKGAIRYNSTNNNFDYCGGSGPAWTSFAGSATPAGSDQQVQYNNNGVLAASSGMTFNSTTGVLNISGAYQIGGANGLSYPSADTTAGATIAIGSGALGSLPATGTSYGNTAIGYQTAASISMTSASNNLTAVGYRALNAVTGQENTAVGSSAGLLITSGIRNTVVGYMALSANTIASYNTAIGRSALQSATGSSNSALGYAAGQNISSGTGNTAIGYNAALGTSGAKITGTNNTVVGYQAGLLLQGATATNALFGASAGAAITTGSSNVVIGPSVASTTLATGSNNILIGTGSGVDTASTSTSNYLNIGGVITGDLTAGDLSVSASWKIGSSQLGCITTTKGAIRYNSTNNNFDYCGGSGPAWTSFASSVTPGGSDQQVQLNNNGVLYASTGLTFSSSTGVLSTALLRTGAGTVAAPSYSFTADTDTGLYNIGANSIGIATNGVLRLTIQDPSTTDAVAVFGGTSAITLPGGLDATRPSSGVNGMVRYNTTSNDFDIYANGAWKKIVMGASSAATAGVAGSDKQIQYNNGGSLAGASGLVYNSATFRFGINTASPATILDVNGTLRMAYSGESCSASTLGAMYYSSATGLFYACGTAGSWTQVATGSSNPAAGSTGYVQFRSSTGNLGGDSGLFWDDSNKYLGVGTTSPQASLHVSGGNLLLNNNWGINLRNSSGTDVGTAFKLTSGDNLEIRNLTTTGSVQISAVNDTGIIQFLTGSSTTEKMRIANNGNVGIGTASPAAKLDVADAIRVGSSQLGCATGTKGAIRYNSTNNNFDYCGGSGPAWTSFTGSVTAAGSTGYVQFKSSTGSLGGDSGLFWDDTNKRLGIGTAAPGTTLEIAGATRVTGGGDIGIVNGSTPASMFLQGASDGSKYSILYLTNNNFTRSWNFEHRADVTNAFQLTYYNGTTYTRQIFIDPTGSSVSVGASAGANLTATALQNALTGYSAGSSISTGDYNTAIGGGSLATLSTNNGSTAVGYNALNVATGGGNIAIGYQAGDAISTGTNNIVIGYDVDAPSATTSNQLVIGNLLFGTGLDGTGTSLSSGKIGIGTSSPAAKLDVADAVRVGSSTLGCATGTKGAIRYNSTNNSFDYCGGSTPSWTSFSGSVTPAGSDQQVQLNSNGVLYASTGLTFSSSTGVLTVANRAIIGGSGKNSNSVFVTGGNLTATGADNVVIGSNAGNALTTSNANVVIGKDALKTQSTAGGANVAIGYQALQLNTSANNVAVGYLALGSNSIQQNNTAIGYQAATATTGGNAVAVGYLALSASGASDGSVALGAGALSSATGTGNIGIGNDAGNNITSGAKNIVIGYDIDAPSATTSNQLNIGNVLFGTGFNGTNAATVNTAGKVGIVTNSPAAALDVADAIRVGSSTLGCATGTKGAIRYNSTNNNFDYCGGSGPAWTSFTGSVTAAGSTGYVQFKSSTGSLGGDSGLFWDDTNKFLGIGTTSPGSLINTAKTFTAGSTGWGEGVLFTATGNGASASYLGVVGTRSYATINSTGTTHEAFGVYGSGYAGNDATAQQATAFLADFRLYAGDTGYGISIQDDNASTGGTGYGVYINLDDTNITRYGIYQVTANNNYFAGNIGIGTASPAAPLDVSGAIRVGSSTLGCATGTKGSIRYNSTGNNFDYCGGAGPTWTAFGTPPAETIPINDLSDAKTDYTTDHNMWLGSGAGAAIASGGQYNVALGENAGAAVSTGDNNIFIGESAGAAVNTGTGNVGIGRWALKTATSGSNNTAIGYLALQTATGGSNTSVGSDSSRTLTTGVSNTALGNGALYTNSTSNDNTAIGFNALQLATGANNIGLGSKAGDAITTGGNNIVIGYDVDAPSATTSNQLNVGNVMFGTGFNVTNGTTVNTSGRVGIAKNNPAVTLDVVGDIQYTGTITDVSDRRLKKDIHPLAERGSMLEKLGGLGTYSFRMKNTGPDDANQVEFGVMAQEIEKVFPELVRHDDSPEHYMSVNYVGLIAPMIEAGKELEAQNKAMKAEIAGLKAQQAEMKTAMADIQASVNGLKAHTGYGIGKAGIDSWVLLLLAGIAAGNIAVISLMFRRKKQP